MCFCKTTMDKVWQPSDTLSKIPPLHCYRSVIIESTDIRVRLVVVIVVTGGNSVFIILSKGLKFDTFSKRLFREFCMLQRKLNTQFMAQTLFFYNTGLDVSKQN
jgi:hypothetical protein